MNKWTRRGFIAAGVATGGVLVVGVALREGHRAPKLAGMVTGDDETLVNVWVKLAADNTVTAIVPHSEMGQGVGTAMAQMLAEELDADWALVRFEQAPAHEAYANYPLGREFIMNGRTVPGFVQPSLNGGFLRIAQAMSLQITGGSTAVRFTGEGGMRIAGAAAREMLVAAAAESWGVPAASLRTERSHIYHDPSDRSAPYAQFADAASRRSPPTQPTLKSRDQFTLMGRPIARHDIPSKTDGSAQFAMDISLPGLRYAAVLGAPVIGARVARLDDTAARARRGVREVLNEGDFVAVVADSYWHAEQAVRELDVEWEATGRETLNDEAIFAGFRASMARAIDEGSEQVDVRTGDARGAAVRAPRAVEAEYQVPYLAHAAMEPLNATAHVRDGKVDLWIGHQNPLGVRDSVADALDVDKQAVTVHNCLLGGGFGRKAESDYPLMAARIAARLDTPVKMIWSREQDTRQDFYRPATSARMIAGLGDDGLPVSWDYQYVNKHDPAEASHIPYAIPNQLIHHAETDNPVRFGPWRSVDHTQHGFFIESFIDELAHAAGIDPLQYRQRLLAEQPRHLEALAAVQRACEWDRQRPRGVGLGVALVESFGTLCAQVAEVDATRNTPRVTRVWAAADPGFVVNPDGFTAQIESGIVFGLSAVLYGRINIENGAVVQSNFHDYPVVRMPDAPEIRVTLINSGARLGGAGEPGTPPIAPAVANALFAATGERRRFLPLLGRS